ncbi:LPXTG cell wall anchor domain-containing protein [Kitasatospora sp. NPDC096147]|uniref:LPXTG cell wall anchor domain-containing protein n=1 Tax=Kitasatospora sp. NPDC096147 TaxID=3364093 RepID=UPI003800B9BD
MNARPRPRNGLTVPAAIAAVLALTGAVTTTPAWAAPVLATPAAPPAAAPATTVPTVACESQDSPDKGWIQVFYVHREGRSRFGELREGIQRIAWDVDQTFDASARRFGQNDSRRLRFVQTPDCRIEVTPIALAGLPDTLALGKVGEAVEKAVRSQVAKGDDRWFQRHKPLYFVDVEGADGCGIGGGSDAGGLGDGFGMTTLDCWGEAAMTHELIHGFGISHCDENHEQGNDPICRGYDPTPRCDDVLAGFVLDCRKDEFAYFDPRPAPGSVLDREPGRNVANSAYLIRSQPTPALDVRLLNLSTGACLTAAGPDRACGPAETWQRTVRADGYLRFELKGTGTCLTAPATDPKGAALAACNDGDQRQNWWVEDGYGPLKDHLQLINRATTERIAGGGDSGSYKLLPAGAPVPSAAPTPNAAPKPTTSGSTPTARPSASPTRSKAAVPDAPIRPSGSTSPSARPAGSTPVSGTAAPDTGTGLAATGTDSDTLLVSAVGGLALLGLGAGLLLGNRRRRARAASRHGR